MHLPTLAPFNWTCPAFRSRLGGTALLSCAALLALTVAACAAEDPVSEDPPDPNPPTVAQTIDDQEMKADEEPRDFDLDPVFDDPADEGINYAAESSNTDVIEASISAATLTIDPNGGGEATVTVEAENDGGTAETSFDVEVILPDPPDRPASARGSHVPCASA